MQLKVQRVTLVLSFWLNLGIGLVFVAAATGLVVLVNSYFQKQALIEAEAKGRIILDHNLAIHTYFTHQLKPPLFKLMEGQAVPEGYFEPRWMSSTYAVREITKYFNRFNDARYYYKESAVRARSPENEADAFEREYLASLQKDHRVSDYAGIRMLNDKPYFVTMRRGEMMERDCLRCHSAPQLAPQGLLDIYGPERSFNRNVGDVVSALSVRIPLEQAYAEVRGLSWRLSLFLFAAFVLLFAGQYALNRRFLFSPLNRVRLKALQIAASEAHLGEQIPLPAGREMADLTEAFNTMSRGLRRDRDELERRVGQRTAELSTVNAELVQEIRRREAVEAQLREANRQLEQLSRLDGLLGIANRRCFDEYLSRELERALRLQSPLSLILIDLDHFKHYNDRYGHIAGDHCLRETVRALEANLKRPTDLLARYGGEELVVVLPDTAAIGAYRIAERLRTAVEALAISHAASPSGPYLTISLGVHTLQPAPGDTPETLIQRADQALYEAKRLGRNRTVATT